MNLAKMVYNLSLIAKHIIVKLLKLVPILVHYKYGWISRLLSYSYGTYSL